jgi:pimeloyl-ACP methyl ester carboxylesterase
VVYFHGTPDCRLAVPPLTAEAAEGLNIRLVSFDRPGLGDSDPDEHSGPESVAEIVAELVDGLGLHNPVFLAWSAGALFALAAAARLGDRCGGLVLAAPLAPLSSLEDPSVAAVVGSDRTAFAEMAAEMGPDEAARTLAPYLVPYGASAELARQITAHVDNELDRAELEATPGATEMLAAALMGTMVTGMGGIERDLLAAGSPVDFAAITCPTVVISAELDDRCPPAMADWIAGRIDGAIHETVDGRGHLFPLGDWAGLLRRAQELRG